jgi:hypothetical protein
VNKPVLHHYTSAAGRAGILATKSIHPSTKAHNPKDARFGDGQYLTDIEPGTKRLGQLSRIFLGIPWGGKRFTDYVSIRTGSLNVIFCRAAVFVIPNSRPLDISDRLVADGKN